MPLSDQETRCIERACDHLSSILGGPWTTESYPDELYPNEPTPEVVVTSGRVRAAIEVKRLTGDSMYQAYKENLLSNQKFLKPLCGGYYTLIPSVDFRLPMDLTLRRHVKRKIERCAPAMKPGDASAVHIPRHGIISLISESGPPYVMCYHGGPLSELLRPLMERIEGKFMLVDEGLQHSFVTEDGRNAFYDAVVGAYERRVNGDATQFTWDEEWELRRLEHDDEEDEDDKDGVWIIAATEARHMRESVGECIDAVMDNALRKFDGRRWADYHVLALEASIHAPERLVTEVVAAFEPGELEDVDFILLIDGKKVVQCYPAIQ